MIHRPVRTNALQTRHTGILALRRRFDDSVGYGPKTLQRVLRLWQFLAASGTDIAAAAIDAGYADQAHLTRECRVLTGLAPSEWVSQPPPRLLKGSHRSGRDQSDGA